MKKILVVDDKEEGRYLLEVLLKGNGYEVRTASNGEEALKALKKEEVDLIISDILMPVMDGFELCRRVRKDKRLRNIPFIIYTATYTGPGDEEFALKIGADRFVQKPCEPDALLSVINEVITTTIQREVVSMKAQEKEVYKVYSERLIRKLEQKAEELGEEVQRRKEAEKIAQTSAENWRTTFDAIPDPTALFETNGTVKQCNRAFAEFLGKDPRDLVGEKCFRMVHKTENYIDDCPLLRSLKSSVQETLVMSAGQRTFLVIVDPVKDSTGKITGFVHIMRDVTELKEREKSLRESEKRYRNLVEGSFDGIFIQKGPKIIYVNQRLCEMLGYDQSEMIGMDHWLVYHPDYQKLTRERAIARMRGELVPHQYEVKLQRKDGSLFDGEISAQRIMFGDEPGIQVWVKDITEQKEAVEKLRSSEVRYRTLVESTSDAIVLLDPERRIVSCNQAFCTLFGYDRNEVEGKSIRIIHLSDGSLQSFGEQVYPIVKKEGSCKVEWDFVHKDGTMFPTEVVLSAIKSSVGSITGYVSIIRDITERKRTEEVLRKSEERYRYISELISDYAYAFKVEPDGQFKGEWLTESFTRVFGFTREEIEERGGWQTLVHPDDLPIASKHAMKVANGESDICEWRFITRNGEVRWIRDYAVPLWDENQNRVDRIYGAAQDITEYKKADQLLRESEERFRRLAESSPVGIYIIYNDKFRYVNQAFSLISGYNVEEIIDRISPLDLVHPEDRARIAEILNKGISGGIQETHFEIRGIRKDGSMNYCEIHGRRIDYNGEIGIIGTLMDITERKQVEQALRESEARWQFALEGAGDGVWDWNAQTNHVFYSRQWKKMLGFEEDEIGDTLDEWDKRVHPEDRDYVYGEINKHFGGITPVYISEHRVKCKDGSYKWILDRGKVIEWTEDGKPLRVIGTHSDITDRKKAEQEMASLQEQFRQAQKMEAVGRLAGGGCS